MTRRTIAWLMAALAFSAFAAGDDDVALTFSTKGPDRYLDGSVVLDGECYALVWSADGVFDGFAADGSPLDANDKVVRVGAVARKGRCNVLFQLPAAQAKELEGGVYAVYLLDTRVVAEDGTVAPRGVAGGGLTVLNGYGEISEGASVPSSSGGAAIAEARRGKGGEGQRAAVCARAPADVRQPRVLKMDVGDDEVVLYVENLPGYMRAQGGADTRTGDTVSPAVAADGGAAPVRIALPAQGDKGFFKVVRSE